MSYLELCYLGVYLISIILCKKQLFYMWFCFLKVLSYKNISYWKDYIVLVFCHVQMLCCIIFIVLVIRYIKIQSCCSSFSCLSITLHKSKLHCISFCYLSVILHKNISYKILFCYCVANLRYWIYLHYDNQLKGLNWFWFFDLKIFLGWKFSTLKVSCFKILLA